jgi:xanthine dehydrogenase accessory factor
MDIFEQTLAALQEDGQLILATIISSSGSTPVPTGAKLLLRVGGTIPLGTVGGGCIEADVIEAARQLAHSGGTCLIRRFTLTEDDIESGMLCGGTMDVLIEVLSKEHSSMYAELLSRREAGRDSVVVTLIGSGPKILGKFLVSSGPAGADDEDVSLLRGTAIELPAAFQETLHSVLTRQAVTRLASARAEFIIEPVVGLQDLLIFGGGHVSRYVSRSAAMAGFRVTVIDERPEYANPQRFPEAYRTLAVGFDASWSQLRIMPPTSIVIVTRGHKFDELVLERAVDTPARYVGMIGSRRKVAATFTNMLSRGISRERLQKVHAPIGLHIGAVTAEEIGISITAELIAVRRGVSLPARSMSDVMAGFFHA